MNAPNQAPRKLGPWQALVYLAAVLALTLLFITAVVGLLKWA